MFQRMQLLEPKGCDMGSCVSDMSDDPRMQHIGSRPWPIKCISRLVGVVTLCRPISNRILVTRSIRASAIFACDDCLKSPCVSLRVSFCLGDLYVRSMSRFACLPSFSKIGSIVLLLLLTAWADIAQAQTAHFGGTARLFQAENLPEGVVVDAAGDVFVAVAAPGVSSGSPTQISEIAADGTVTPSINLGGYTLTDAVGLATDSLGYIYIVDKEANNTGRVLKVKTDGSSASVVPTGALTNPGYVAVDGSGDVFVEDNITSNTSRVVKVPSSNGTYGAAAVFVTSTESIGSGGPLQYVQAIAVDPSGNLLITDINLTAAGARVIKITPAGAASELIPYTESIGTGGTLINTFGVAADAQGDVFLIDIDINGQGRVIELPYAAGSYGTPFEYITPGSGTLVVPYGLAIDSKANLYVSDYENDPLNSNYNGGVIEISTASTNFGAAPIATTTPATLPLTFTIDTSGTLNSTTPYTVLTQGQTKDAQGNALDFAAASSGNTCTGQLNSGTTCVVNVTFTPKRPGARYGAVELFDSFNNVIATAYVYGTGQGPQISFNQGNNPTAITPLGVGNIVEPYNLTVDAAGNIFVADYGSNEVKEMTAASGYSTVKTLGDGSFNKPIGVAVDGAGNVFVADTYNNEIKEILAGDYTTVHILANGNFSAPDDVAVDGSGNVFVTDTNNNLVKEIVAAGGYTTVKTLGLPGYFSGPAGIALDANGNIFVANSTSRYLEEIPVAGGYTTVNVLPQTTYPVGLAGGREWEHLRRQLCSGRGTYFCTENPGGWRVHHGN